jgi:hypothetical protein
MPARKRSSYEERKRKWRKAQRNPVEFIRRVTDIDMADTQKRILKSVRDNRRTSVVSGNGVGKSFGVSSSVLWWSLTRPDSVVLITSGSYSQMEDTLWRPLKALLKKAKMNLKFANNFRALDSNPPRLEGPEEEWYAKLVSPRNPDGLEGRHNADTLVVIEEADKPEITEAHFDSAGSAITDASDRMIALGNPPRTEGNSFYQIMESDRWTNVQFSSFESHNVQLDLGEDGERIPGLVDLPLIASDWEDYNGRSWPGLDVSVETLIDRVADGDMERSEMIDRLMPGVEQVRNAHRDDSGLSERWYRRRAGVVPKADARPHRPIYAEDVRRAFDKSSDDNGELKAVGVDVARKGGDSTVVCKLYENAVEFDSWSHKDHEHNKGVIKGRLDEAGNVDVAIDAVGEGSGLADYFKDHYGAVRFKNGERARAEEDYRNCWTEALHHGGTVLDRLSCDGCPQKFREDLFSAARVVSYEERQLRGGDVLEATSKGEIKEHQGRSPDHLDAYLMACWVSEAEQKKTAGTIF